MADNIVVDGRLQAEAASGSGGSPTVVDAAATHDCMLMRSKHYVFISLQVVTGQKT